MAHILLLETEKTSPVEEFLREMDHRVTRVLRPNGKRDGMEQEAAEIGSLAFPDLIIREDGFGEDYGGDISSIPHILIVREYDPAELQAQLSFSCHGFLLRPVHRESVLSVVGTALGMGGISLDISDKKQELLEIRKLSTAIDQSDNIILITDCEGRIEFANRAFETSFGVAREELIGEMVHDLNDGSDRAQCYAIVGEAVELEHTVMREFSFARNDYSSSWERISVSPIRNDESEIINYIAVADDITMQVQRKRELERAKEEAESASRMKSQFLANITHEIRTPLNIILGFTDILADDEIDEKKRTQLMNIRYAGNNLLSLIDDILDFSKIESSKLRLEEKPFSLQATLYRMEEMYRSAASQKGISFRMQHESPFPRTVKGDEDRVVQILSNLLSNAVKFTSEGSIELKSRYRDDELEVCITDTGIGIEEARKEEIFSPFEQIDGSTSRKYGGTGLGLAITKSLVEQMGGRIELESSLGSGTAFTVTIPLPSLDDKRVLIAEDNGVNQRLMRIMLEKMGYSCDVASDGVKTMERLRERHYDVLLLDMHMPVKDGLEVVEELRSDESLRGIHVIALTASTEDGDEANFISAGCDDFLPKPVNKNDLETKLRNIST